MLVEPRIVAEDAIPTVTRGQSREIAHDETGELKRFRDVVDFVEVPSRLARLARGADDDNAHRLQTGGSLRGMTEARS
jgi:hypothetical protein